MQRECQVQNEAELEVVLDAGGYITKPRGELHTMWNAGSSPARMIEVISPGQPDWLPGLISRYHLTPPPGT